MGYCDDFFDGRLSSYLILLSKSTQHLGKFQRFKHIQFILSSTAYAHQVPMSPSERCLPSRADQYSPSRLQPLGVLLISFT
jgi:hypothetical protein